MEDKKVIKRFQSEENKWTSKAKEFTDKDKFNELKDKVFKKMEGGSEKLQEGFSTMKRFVSMVTDFFKNDFLIEKKELLLILGGLVYFISPIDIVPDFIPLAGLLDDVAIIGFIANKLVGTIGQYEEYQRDFEIREDDLEVIDVEVEENDNR